jgi:hypothetical protein
MKYLNFFAIKKAVGKHSGLEQHVATRNPRHKPDVARPLIFILNELYTGRRIGLNIQGRKSQEGKQEKDVKTPTLRGHTASFC